MDFLFHKRMGCNDLCFAIEIMQIFRVEIVSEDVPGTQKL